MFDSTADSRQRQGWTREYLPNQDGKFLIKSKREPSGASVLTPRNKCWEVTILDGWWVLGESNCWSELDTQRVRLCIYLTSLSTFTHPLAPW